MSQRARLTGLARLNNDLNVCGLKNCVKLILKEILVYFRCKNIIYKLTHIFIIYKISFVERYSWYSSVLYYDSDYVFLPFAQHQPKHIIHVARLIWTYCEIIRLVGHSIDESNRLANVRESTIFKKVVW